MGQSICIEMLQFRKKSATFFWTGLSTRSNMDEKALVSRIIAGDRRAFSQLISQYQRLVGHIVFRMVDHTMDREEIAQDVFVKVFHRINDFQFQSKLSTWIATIAYRHTLNFLKRNKKWQGHKELNEDLDIALEESTYEVQDQAAFVRKAVEQLPLPYRTVLTLYHLDGFSYPEIVDIMEMPEGTVKNYLFRARKKMKTLLEPFLEKEVLI